MTCPATSSVPCHLLWLSPIDLQDLSQGPMMNSVDHTKSYVIVQCLRIGFLLGLSKTWDKDIVESHFERA